MIKKKEKANGMVDGQYKKFSTKSHFLTQ